MTIQTPFFKKYLETLLVNSSNLTINANTTLDSDITFFQNSTKAYPYYSKVYPVSNREQQYFDPNQHKCLTFPIAIFKN